MTKPKFYLDENVPTEVAALLLADGIDIITAHSQNMLGSSDIEHFHYAIKLGCVLCTQDKDFLRIHQRDAKHCGILYGKQRNMRVEKWVKAIRYYYDTYTAEMFVGELFKVGLDGE
jgi:predicted nuclease of predicted toxin-antitoxin system